MSNHIVSVQSDSANSEKRHANCKL